MTSASPCQEIRAVQRWLTDVVIGLNLCPFAARPTSQKQVHFAMSDARNEEALIQDLQQELLHISQRQPTELETSLLIIPHALADFFDCNQFANWVDKLLENEGWEGTFQVASFHPSINLAAPNRKMRKTLPIGPPIPFILSAKPV